MNNEIQQKAKDVFAENLTRLMKRNGKTQADIVSDLNYTASTVSDWVNAKKYPRVDRMQTLADYFNVSIDDLRAENGIDVDYDPELNAYLEELKNRSEMRMLFKVSKGCTKAEVEQAVRIIEALRRKD